jgi:transposase
MIPAPTRVWLVVEPIDMRAGIDGLSLKIQQALGRSPCDGTAYAFRNRNGTRIKVLIWDGTGVWLCVRRLHQGRFTWPQSNDVTCILSLAEWRWLTTGIDWHRLQAKPSAQWQV